MFSSNRKACDLSRTIKYFVPSAIEVSIDQGFTLVRNDEPNISKLAPFELGDTAV